MRVIDIWNKFAEYTDIYDAGYEEGYAKGLNDGRIMASDKNDRLTNGNALDIIGHYHKRALEKAYVPNKIEYAKKIKDAALKSPGYKILTDAFNALIDIQDSISNPYQGYKDELDNIIHELWIKMVER